MSWLNFSEGFYGTRMKHVQTAVSCNRCETLIKVKIYVFRGDNNESALISMQHVRYFRVTGGGGRTGTHGYTGGGWLVISGTVLNVGLEMKERGQK